MSLPLPQHVHLFTISIKNKARLRWKIVGSYSRVFTILELRGDIARMIGFLNNTTIRTFDKRDFTLALPKTGNQYFYVYTDVIKSQHYSDIVVPVLRTVTVKEVMSWKLCQQELRKTTLCASKQKNP